MKKNTFVLSIVSLFSLLLAVIFLPQPVQASIFDKPRLSDIYIFTFRLILFLGPAQVLLGLLLPVRFIIVWDLIALSLFFSILNLLYGGASYIGAISYIIPLTLIASITSIIVSAIQPLHNLQEIFNRINIYLKLFLVFWMSTLSTILMVVVYGIFLVDIQSLLLTHSLTLLLVYLIYKKAKVLPEKR